MSTGSHHIPRVLYQCLDCGWFRNIDVVVNGEAGRTTRCPSCGSTNVERTEEEEVDDDDDDDD